MAIQTVPYALQNASHSAALFRQSASAPFAVAGTLGVDELAVSQQGTPNMSVILGPGRAKVAGTAVSAPTDPVTSQPFGWTTQAMYDVLNDANLTLTVAASNPTNPRIDAVYVQVQDAFYSGALNQAIAGIVTGVPAASPAAPAVPTNSVLVAYIAVAANATTIVNANITSKATIAQLLGLTDGGWLTLAANAGGGWSIVTQPQYRKIGSTVFLRGQVSKSSAITAADPMTAAMPAGYRPSVLEPISAVHSNGTPCAAGVQPTGVVSGYPAVTSPSTQMIFHGAFIAEA